MANMSTENSNQDTGGRAILWMIPRTISTAFTKCMTGIPDCEIWMEPFGFSLGAGAEMMKAGITEVPMAYDGNEREFQIGAEGMEKVLNCKFIADRLPYATIRKGMEESKSKYVFAKDESIAMTTDQKRQYIPKGYKHAFIIRHPILVFKSFRKSIYLQYSQVGMLKHNEDEASFDYRKYAKDDGIDDIFQAHHELWTYIRENIDPSPLVIDSSDLLANPAAVLSKYCDTMGYPYSDSLLEWDGSSEVGRSWKWPSDDMYKNEVFLGAAMCSTHFTPPTPVPSWDELTEDVRELSAKAMPYYEDMLKHRLIVE